MGTSSRLRSLSRAAATSVFSWFMLRMLALSAVRQSMTHAGRHNDRYRFVANLNVMCVERFAMRVINSSAIQSYGDVLVWRRTSARRLRFFLRGGAHVALNSFFMCNNRPQTARFRFRFFSFRKRGNRRQISRRLRDNRPDPKRAPVPNSVGSAPSVRPDSSS